MAIRNAKVEVTFAQRDKAIMKLRMVVFFGPGLEMLFFIELAINRKIGVYLKYHIDAFEKQIFGKVIIEGTVYHEGKLLIIR